MGALRHARRRNPTRSGWAAIAGLAAVAVSGFVYAIRQWRKGMLLLPGASTGPGPVVNLVAAPIPSPSGTPSVGFATSSDPRVVVDSPGIATPAIAVVHARKQLPLEVRIDVPDSLGSIVDVQMFGETWLQLGGSDDNYAIIMVPSVSDPHGNPSAQIELESGKLDIMVV